MTPRTTPGSPPSLVERRERVRLEDTRHRIGQALAAVQGGLSRLHDNGLLFTRHGARVALDLLRAQALLLKANGLVEKAELAGAPGPSRLESLLDAVDGALDKAAVLARRHRTHVAPASDRA